MGLRCLWESWPLWAVLTLWPRGGQNGAVTRPLTGSQDNEIQTVSLESSTPVETPPHPLSHTPCWVCPRTCPPPSHLPSSLPPLTLLSLSQNLAPSSLYPSLICPVVAWDGSLYGSIFSCLVSLFLPCWNWHGWFLCVFSLPRTSNYNGTNCKKTSGSLTAHSLTHIYSKYSFKHTAEDTPAR